MAYRAVLTYVGILSKIYPNEVGVLKIKVELLMAEVTSWQSMIDDIEATTA